MAIVAARMASLSEVLEGNQYIQATMGPNQEILLLTSDKTSGYRVHTLTSEGWRLILSLAPTSRRFSFVQPLPGEHFLVVESRLWQDRSPNAYVFDQAANVIASFVAGDGIEHVQTTRRGDIWIGYFDEGVYKEGQLGNAGLVCLDSSGQPLLRYADDVAESNGLPFIDDCYALNVAKEDEVWIAYYSHFPLVKLRARRLDQSWLDWPARPVRAFAVDEARLLMVPAYRREGPLYDVNLKATTIGEVSIVDEAGQPIRFDFSFGRGSILCLVSLQGDKPLYSIDLRSQ